MLILTVCLILTLSNQQGLLVTPIPLTNITIADSPLSSTPLFTFGFRPNAKQLLSSKCSQPASPSALPIKKMSILEPVTLTYVQYL